ncbi:Polysaccharide biosynthesis/export protein [Planctomycetes bacterium Poly30]|uniref:Polysaccharide biosynthesis/export protein n=1 Tax=Saltatorellus ferox TaxID=2528018 RepID=A0A518EPQ0_9BACT|nr:Polysaccharide biosynthesis/export protein [Planctomycetes bacterium Poly30]
MCQPVDPSTRSASSHRAAKKKVNALRAPLLRAVAALAVCLAGTACRTAPAPVSTTDRFDTFETAPDWSVASLGPGDVLRVTIHGHPELSTPDGGAHVDETGVLELPVVGPVSVADLDLRGANERIEESFRKYMHEPDVTVDIVRRESKQYFVLGQIREPGPRVLERPTTALEAVSHGSFFLNAADRRSLFLVRPHGDELEVHRFNAETPDPSGLVQVRPGDIVFVRRRGSQRFQEEFLPLLAPFNLAIPSLVASGAL